MDATHVIHPFEPICDINCRILILGSFPSVKSRETSFYYGHKQNRFWKVLSFIYNAKEPISIEEKTNFLLDNHTAIWDVIKSCDIIASSDSSIKNVTVNDIAFLCKQFNINKIFANGKTSADLYNRYIYPTSDIPIVQLPSTSPANAAYSLERLIEAWKVIIK